MQPIVVQKYGGSSVADTERIKHVAQRIADTREAGKQVCVVVSAMGSTTNELVARAREISGAPPRRELDMLLTCGERASMALLSMAVSALGYEAISFTGSQCGIMTNDRHSGARIVEVRPFRVEDELARGRVVIVAGFQGVSYKREITTLGRGGSDTTAVALAAALGAEYCEICSDVDGIYSADPRLVSAAELLEAISHDEMLELAAHGARVLHPAAVEYAKKAGIALWARATTGGGAGTRIDAVPDAERLRAVAGVTGQHRLVALDVTGARLPALLAALRDDGLSVQHVLEHDGAVRVVLSLDDVPDWAAVRERLSAAVDGALDEETGWGAVSVVGDSVGTDPEILDRALAAAGGVTRLGLSTAPQRITIYCRASDVDGAVRAMHRALCEEQ